MYVGVKFLGHTVTLGLRQWLRGKESAYSAGDAGDTGLILGQEDPLEEEMATYPSILAWEIPWTEEPGGLHTLHGVTEAGLVTYDLVTEHLHTYNLVD